MRLAMPSRPARSIAEKARYGFDVESGQRNSTRLARGLSAGRAGCGTTPSGCAGEYTRFTGAS